MILNPTLPFLGLNFSPRVTSPQICFAVAPNTSRCLFPQICFAVANISRCVWTLETRLIETNLAYCELIGSTLLSFGLCYLCYTYNDATNIKPPRYLEALALCPIAMLLAFLFHPGDDWFTLQILVAFTMYIEAIGMIPQLW